MCHNSLVKMLRFLMRLYSLNKYTITLITENAFSLYIAIYYSHSKKLWIPWLWFVWTIGPTWWPLVAGTVWSKAPMCPRSTQSPLPQSTRPAESHQPRNSSWLVAGRGSCPQSHMTRRPVPLQKHTQRLCWGQEETGQDTLGTIPVWKK